MTEDKCKIATRGVTYSTEDKYDYKEEKLDFDTIQFKVSSLQGKVLTIIEAVMTDEKQLEATKSLIKSVFGDKLSDLSEMCYTRVPKD